MELGDQVKTRFGNGMIIGKDLLKHNTGQWWYVKLDWQKKYKAALQFQEGELKYDR